MIENDSLVSINIYDKNTHVLYNKNCVPILFYWNGQGNLLNCILKDNVFIDRYLNNINEYNVFKNLELSYFYFKFNEDNEEIYTDNRYIISDFIRLKDFNSINIIYNLLMPHFYSLYKMALNKDYEKVKIFNNEIIVEIYKDIKNKYNEKIEKTTIINWVRSELLKENILDKSDINYIIQTLTKILEYEN